jgi:hypothetical protein
LVDLAEAGDADVGIDLRGAEAAVAKEFLDNAQVGAGVEEVRGVAVAEFVGGEVEGETGKGKVFFEE